MSILIKSNLKIYRWATKLKPPDKLSKAFSFSTQFSIENLGQDKSWKLNMSDEPTRIDFSQKEKFDFFDANINQNDILLQLDARREDCSLPSNLKGEHSLTLKMSNAFVYPPQYDRIKIVANLKFNGEYFECSIPWNAIWAMSAGDQNQKLWQKDMPSEVAVGIAKDILKQAGRTIQEKLGLVKNTKKEIDKTSEKNSEKGSEKKERTKKATHLKRIK